MQKFFKILYVGHSHGTAGLRMQALRRIGHDVRVASPYVGLPRGWAYWLHGVGGIGIDSFVAASLSRQLQGYAADMAVVDSGEVIGPKALAIIRRVAPLVANVNLDNPYHDPPPERRRWQLFRRAARLYDLAVVPRREGIEAQMRRLGVRAPMPIWQCADEVANRRIPWSDDAEKAVIFVGVWMPGRDTLLAELIEAGIPLRIFGARWERAPHLKRIESALTNRFLSGDDYGREIAKAQIALVMLNGANFDLHTTRSAEIPAIGAAMVAPRTSHHEALFEDGREAMFYSDAGECAAQCWRLLSDDDLRRRIADAGHARTFANGTFNEPLMQGIVDELMRPHERREKHLGAV